MKKVEIVADDEDTGPEPEGFWEPIHAEVARLIKGGEDGTPGSS